MTLGSLRGGGRTVLALVVGSLVACTGEGSRLGGAAIPSSATRSGTTGLRPQGPARSGVGEAATSGAPAGSMPQHADAGVADSPECRPLGGSFEAIQKVIFEGRGCTQEACHGDAQAGGLDLRAEVAWENLVSAPSTGSEDARVRPGAPLESFLYSKLRSGTYREFGTIGSPMPMGATPLSKDELEAIELWIRYGAPREGVIADATPSAGVQELLDACLPPATLDDTTLESPDSARGIQLVLPSYELSAGAEVEQCIPFAYDLTDKVPAQYRDEDRNVVFVNGSIVRQGPQSQRMVVWNPGRDLSQIPAEEEWTCRGGDVPGARCDPTRGSADCPGEEGVCAGPARSAPLCGVDRTDLAGTRSSFVDWLLGALGVVPLRAASPEQIAGAQSSDAYVPPFEGVYSEIPLRGVLWLDTHAVNPAAHDAVVRGRVNYLYASSRRRRMTPLHVMGSNRAVDGIAPFTREIICDTYTAPQHFSIAMMTSHTHRRGERFWVTDAAGATIYDSTSYSDPAYRLFEPWLDFPQADEASRTLEYCAVYNNGLTEDGEPDLQLVTRASRMPAPTRCTPVACTHGRVTEACASDADCDTVPGAADGFCDACPIQAGVTTESEAFMLMPWLVAPD